MWNECRLPAVASGTDRRSEQSVFERRVRGANKRGVVLRFAALNRRQYTFGYNNTSIYTRKY